MALSFRPRRDDSGLTQIRQVRRQIRDREIRVFARIRTCLVIIAVSDRTGIVIDGSDRCGTVKGESAETLPLRSSTSTFPAKSKLVVWNEQDIVLTLLSATSFQLDCDSRELRHAFWRPLSLHCTPCAGDRAWKWFWRGLKFGGRRISSVFWCKTGQTNTRTLITVYIGI